MLKFRQRIHTEIDVKRIKQYAKAKKQGNLYGVLRCEGHVGRVNTVKQEIEAYFKSKKDDFNCFRIYYTGHGERGTGDWCFYDDTISFEWISQTFQKLKHSGILFIESDCCYSGKWVEKVTKLSQSKNVILSISVHSACGDNQVVQANEYSKKFICNRVEWRKYMSKQYGAKRGHIGGKAPLDGFLFCHVPMPSLI